GIIWLPIVAVIFAVVAAFYYLRVIKYMYFDEVEDERELDVPADFKLALSVNGVAQIVLGLLAGPLLAMCYAAFSLI
ncbi:MAG: NADH:ubiquinone oxidoreductase subunit N, partial [bacterium]